MAAWELNLFIKFVDFIDELLACYMWCRNYQHLQFSE